MKTLLFFTYPASRKMHGKARLLRSNFSNLKVEFHLTVSKKGKFSSKMESTWKCVVTMNKQQLDIIAVIIIDVNITKWSTINRICILNWLSSIREADVVMPKLYNAKFNKQFAFTRIGRNFICFLSFIFESICQLFLILPQENKMEQYILPLSVWKLKHTSLLVALHFGWLVLTTEGR